MTEQVRPVVVITGAGRGLGRALMDRFADEGFQCVGIVRSANADDMHEQITADVSRAEQFGEALDLIRARHGRIDYLFNNAALYPKTDFMAESIEEFDEALRVNVLAPAVACKRVLPVMLEQGFGRVINIGSWADLAPIPRSTAYSTSKGALHALTRAVSADLSTVAAGVDVQVHEWIPGHLNTRMSDFTGIDPAIAAGWGFKVATESPSDRSRIYENDREWQPPVSRLRRLALMLRQPFGR
jgi:NAD(P)-dependent dehydrogenase (short-subunit alcohol dehydrogenase family)